MHDEDGHFGERVAATYDEISDRMFDFLAVHERRPAARVCVGEGDLNG